MAAAASNRSYSTSVAPIRNVEFIATLCPNVWNRGEAVQDDVVVVERVGVKGVDRGAHDQVQVGQQRAFRLAGRSAGVKLHRDVVRFPGDMAGQRRGAGVCASSIETGILDSGGGIPGGLLQAGVRDGQLGIGLGEDVFDLLRGEQRGNGDDYAPRPR